MRNLITTCVLLLLTLNLCAQEDTIFGKWKAIDEKTGEALAIIELYKKDGVVYGKVDDILNPADRDKTCIYCDGDEYNKPILGLDVIKSLEKEGNVYLGGTIFDPAKGKEYKAKIWLDQKDPSRLNVRGYIFFFFRTQQWVRA